MKYTGFKQENHFDNISLYNGDCMDLLMLTPDKYYDLAIVDPPYGIGAPNMAATPCQRKQNKNRLNQGSGKLKNRTLNTSNCDWDNATPTDEYFYELMRTTKDQIIWGGNYFKLPPSRCILCWDKCQPWLNFSQIEIAWTSFDHPAQIFKFDNRTGDKIHPTQKPVALYEWILSKYSQPNQKILDTHIGSASIAIAINKANLLDNKNLQFTGIELDTDYYNAAVNRFINHNAQHTLNF